MICPSGLAAGLSAKNEPAYAGERRAQSVGTHAASVQINPKLPYDPRHDFDYLGLVSSTPNTLFVRKDFPASTLKEYMAYAKAKGKNLKLGHSGIGSAPPHHDRFCRN
jgi:tripartite-type tricarboxylate transporter receptor subunit TctC